MKEDQRTSPPWHSPQTNEWRWLALATALIVLLSFAPHILGWTASPNTLHFTGIVVNVPDNHSYIAKMHQGYDGNWFFRLPFTPEDQEGALLYLPYILLGHVARLSNLPLIAVFQIARGLSSVYLVIATYRLARHLSPKPSTRRLGLVFALFGSGFGWFLIAFGIYTPDLWLPEAFPFQAMVLNVHFPLALALALTLLRLLGLSREGPARLQGLQALATSAILATVRSDLTALILGTVGVTQILRAWRDQDIPWTALKWIAAAALVSAPYIAYQLHALATRPVFKSWISQNSQLTPSLIYLALGYGLMTPLAIIATVATMRHRDDTTLLLSTCLGVMLISAYLPFNSQRRFVMGMGAVLGLLAARAWEDLTHRWSRQHVNLVGWMVAGLAALTNLVLLATWCQKVMAHDPHYFLTKGEWGTMQWMRRELPKDEVVLTSPESGIFIPAWAGQRVVYGHPCETLRAEERRSQVTAFWKGEMREDELCRFLIENDVSYVFSGPREQALENQRIEGSTAVLRRELVFDSGDTTVHQVGETCCPSEQW